MSYNDFSISRSKNLPEVITIEPSVFWDLRGNIYTSYNNEVYQQFMPCDVNFIHDKFAFNRNNVLRGLHGDNKTWKLISCVWGEIYEVVVDMRKESKTYKKWDSFFLSDKKYRQVLIPPGYVNGYYVLSEHAVFHYKLAYKGKYIDAGEQMTYHWDDPQLGINWPCRNPILQDRDR